jgi:glycosyltransferase 2 family protein
MPMVLRVPSSRRQVADMPDSRAVASAVQAADTPGRSKERLLAGVWRLVGTRWAKAVFVLSAVGLAGYAVSREWRHISVALLRLGLPASAAALACVLLGLCATVQVWRLLLASLGSPLPAGVAARIMFIGQLGKYVPGSVWPVLAQMELGVAYRVPRSRSASASVLMILVTLLTGLVLAAVTLPFVAGHVPYQWALLAAPALVALLYPRILNMIIGRTLQLARQPQLTVPLGTSALLRPLCWAFVTWICYGLQIWILATRLGAPAGKTALISLGGFAFAWTVGFMVVFAPAGAGVRDVLLLLVLVPVLGSGNGTAVVMVSRVLLTLGDFLCAGLAARLDRRGRTRTRLPVGDDLGDGGQVRPPGRLGVRRPYPLVQPLQHSGLVDRIDGRSHVADDARGAEQAVDTVDDRFSDRADSGGDDW